MIVTEHFNIVIFVNNRNHALPKRGGGKPKPIMSELIEVQKGLTEEVAALTAKVTQKDTDIIALRIELGIKREKGVNSSEELEAENAALHERVEK